MDMIGKSNEMLAFQAYFDHVHGAGKTRSVSDRPHEECKAFRMGLLAFQANFDHVHGAIKTRSVSDRPHEECKAFRMIGC